MPVFVFETSTRFSSSAELMVQLKAAAGLRVIAQAFDPQLVLSANHLLFAYSSAFKAFERRCGVAKTLQNEMLLRAAATRKVSDAIRTIGVKTPAHVALLVAGSRRDALRLLKLLGAKPSPLRFASAQKRARIAKAFGIAARLLARYSLEDALIEKMALLDLESS